MGEKSLKKAMALPASSMEPLDVEGCFFLDTSRMGLLVVEVVVLVVVPSVGKKGGYTGLFTLGGGGAKSIPSGPSMLNPPP